MSGTRRSMAAVNRCNRSGRCSTSATRGRQGMSRLHRYTRAHDLDPPATPLSRASTLPSRYYLDPDVLELEKDRVFGRTWQLVARAEELAAGGGLRAGDGARRAGGHHPRPRRRAARLLQRLPPSGRPGGAHEGNRKSLQCRYHGWTYGLDGSLAPARDGGDRGVPQGGLRPGAGARGPMGPVRVRQPLRRWRRRWRDVLGAIPAEVERGRLRRRRACAWSSAATT